MQPDPRNEFQKKADAFFNELEKLRQSLLSIADNKIPDIQKTPDKPINFMADLEPEKFKENLASLAARLAKIGWITDANVADENALYAKLTDAGRARFRQSGETYINALPQLFYPKGQISPLPENTIVPKREQTLIVLDLVTFLIQLGLPMLSQGELTVLRGFAAWYAQKMATENLT